MNTANGGDILFHFKGDTSSLSKATKSLGGVTKSILVATGVTKALSSAVNLVTGSTDQAIDRLDTLNNFPKVMSNLGISADEAQKSIDKMSKKLSGLPTTLDQGAMAVQRFTSANGDVAKSTDIFLALNNAIIAGGASAEIQSSALEQLSQAYAKGKPDMMEWRTAMTAMPAQLKQVAKAMGYVSADKLGEDLREGVVSMDEFMEAIIKLNNEGVDGLANFETQARNATSGIKTSIIVAKTQVVKGVTDIIDAINKSLENTPFGSISNVIAKLGEKAKLGLDQVAKLISGEISAKDFGTEITELINKMVVKITENFPKIFNAAVNLLLEFARGLTEPSAIESLITNVSNMITTMLDTIIERLPDIILTAMEIVSNLIEGISQEAPNFFNKIMELTDKLLALLDNEEFMDKLFQAAGKIIESLAEGFIKMQPKLIELTIKLGLALLKEIATLPSKMVRYGADIVIGIWDGIKSKFNILESGFMKKIDGLVEKAKKLLKIASPSKVFKNEIGAMMSKGLGIGFIDTLDNLQDKIHNAINDTFGIGLNPALENSLHYSPNVVVNNNITSNTDSLGQTVTNIKTFANGAKNDYNYGMGV